MELRTKAEVYSFNCPENVEKKMNLENVLEFRHSEGESSKIKQDSNVMTSHTNTRLDYFYFEILGMKIVYIQCMREFSFFSIYFSQFFLCSINFMCLKSIPNKFIFIFLLLFYFISYHIISYHIISYHIISYHLISFDIISYDMI